MRPRTGGSALAQTGHQVVGIDVDPFLIAAAEQDHPGPRWLVGDLAELDVPARGITDGLDAIVGAGNVLPFLAADVLLESWDLRPFTNASEFLVAIITA